MLEVLLTKYNCKILISTPLDLIGTLCILGLPFDCYYFQKDLPTKGAAVDDYS